jgi:uncharacterized protein (DUF1697 family)
MAPFALLLRGVNVGKTKRIAMSDLRALLEGLGHSNVRTLLNSGNAVFSAARGTSAAHAAAIRREIGRKLGFDVAVVVVSAAELDAIVKENRLREAAKDPSRFLVAFACDPKALDAAQGLCAKPWRPDAIAVGSRAAYLWCAAGLIESKLVQAFARAAGERATLRNWATVLKLQAMCAGAAAPANPPRPPRRRRAAARRS